METIIKVYFLEPNSKLEHHVKGIYGVDCWFTVGEIVQHRCLTNAEFELIK